MMNLKELWLATLFIIAIVFVIGGIFSICIFMSKVWEHINKPSAEIHGDIYFGGEGNVRGCVVYGNLIEAPKTPAPAAPAPKK